MAKRGRKPGWRKVPDVVAPEQAVAVEQVQDQAPVQEHRMIETPLKKIQGSGKILLNVGLFCG